MFGSLEQILAAIAKQPGWEEQELYQQAFKSWSLVVTPLEAANSHPLYISRQVLWIATSSAVWAGHLTLKRLFLLKKLNSYLVKEQLSDLRFKHTAWPVVSQTSYASESSPHPSLLPIKDLKSLIDDIPKTTEVMNSFERWAKIRAIRYQDLPLCPRCQAPTPNGEIQRWGVCGCCSHK